MEAPSGLENHIHTIFRPCPDPGVLDIPAHLEFGFRADDRPVGGAFAENFAFPEHRRCRILSPIILFLAAVFTFTFCNETFADGWFEQDGWVQCLGGEQEKDRGCGGRGARPGCGGSRRR